jgi:hypothetical protein
MKVTLEKTQQKKSKLQREKQRLKLLNSELEQKLKGLEDPTNVEEAVAVEVTRIMRDPFLFNKYQKKVAEITGIEEE